MQVDRAFRQARLLFHLEQTRVGSVANTIVRLIDLRIVVHFPVEELLCTFVVRRELRVIGSPGGGGLAPLRVVTGVAILDGLPLLLKDHEVEVGDASAQLMPIEAISSRLRLEVDPIQVLAQLLELLAAEHLLGIVQDGRSHFFYLN